METLNRQSNIELLRILSMLLILVVHVTYLSLGIPTQDMINTSPASSFTHLFFIALSFCAVNVFVLISGYFGIKPTKIKGLYLSFIGLFYPIVIAALYCIFINSEDINFFRVLYLYPHAGWFLLSYFILFLLSPVLNAFVEHISELGLRNVIIAFYAFQSVFGWASNSCVEYEDGYSALSFIGLYLLGQYIRRYPESLHIKKASGHLLFFIGSCLLITIISYCGIRFYSSPLRMFSYISPLVILSSISLFMLFTTFSFYSRSVNYVARSTLAVLLIHTNYLILPHFKQYMVTLYESYNGLLLIFYILISLVSIFMFCVLVDQVRILAWNLVSSKLLCRNKY